MANTSKKNFSNFNLKDKTDKDALAYASEDKIRQLLVEAKSRKERKSEPHPSQEVQPVTVQTPDIQETQPAPEEPVQEELMQEEGESPALFGEYDFLQKKMQKKFFVLYMSGRTSFIRSMDFILFMQVMSGIFLQKRNYQKKKAMMAICSWKMVWEC